MKSLYVFSLLVASAAIFAGCGPGGPTTHSVTGSVTFDGTPVAEGEIIFRDAAGLMKSYGGPITGGEYAFDSEPGKKKVEITAMRDVPGEMDTTSNPGEEVPLREQYIPEKYNVASELTAEVTGSDPIDFPLESQ